jgi:hypothetical protein
MSLLSKASSGVEVMPHCLVIFGLDGIGKTGFAASFPSPFFIDVEGGSKNYNVNRITDLSWLEVIAVLNELKTSEYKTIVIDSLDWLENLLHKHMREKYKVQAVEEAGGGYGKWVNIMIAEWSTLIDELKKLRSLGKNIVMTAHYQIKIFNDPATALGYDRYVMKLNDKVASVLKEWVDCVLFANFETYSTSKDIKATKGKGISTGVRKLYCEKRAAYDAKNRFGLPESINLDYEEFIKLAVVVKPDLKKDIEALLLDVSDKELVEKVKVSMVNADDNKLAQIKNRLMVILQEK